MKTTLKKLSIPKPNGGFDNLYLDDFATYDDLHAELAELKKLVSKLHFEKNEVTEIHPFYIQSLEDENVVYDSSVECRLSYHAADVEYSYGDKWQSLENVENITVGAGERVYFRYVGDEYLSGGVEVSNVVGNELKLRLTTTSKTFDVGGDVRTIVYGNTTKENISGNGLKCFFYGSNVVHADKLNMSVFKSVEQKGCYGMFKKCSSLTTAPEIPATTLKDSCYMEMFSGCTSLTTAPSIFPATTLAQSCYSEMFKNCTGLTTAPELPATTLAKSCYYSMFQGCISLTTAPELPATTLQTYCYNSMFFGCSSLTTAPSILPATTLASGCYYSMFKGCISLTTAPELQATTLASRCYESMFSGCSNLNYIKCLATDMSEIECTTNWVNGVSPTGTFVKAADVSWTTGSSGIPEGWEVKTYNAVAFTAEEAGSTIGLNKLSSYQTLEYKTESSDWTSMSTSTNITLDNIGDKVYVRGVLSGNNSSTNHTQFKMTGKIAASGNCNSLWDYNNLNASLREYCGYRMFQSCTSLTTASELQATTLATGCYSSMFQGCTSLISAPDLPATTLATNCYFAMFSGCTGLTTAPDLPATTLADYCYYYMFKGCTSLTQVPELPATTLQTYCYDSMFYGCTSLTTAPELPATTLADYCYWYMFKGCTSLTQAPELPATTLASSCYREMFYGCTGLTQAPELQATTLANYCYGSMFSGCTSLTQAPELPATTLASDCYEYMFSGCTSLTTSPELPATTLADECYRSMFNGCSNLNYIKCLATDISATNCTTYWVDGVSATGTFVKDVYSSWTVGNSGIPEGWEVKPYNAVAFTAEEAGSTIGLNKLSSYQTLEYRTESSDWTSMSVSTNITLDNIGDKVYVRGVLSGDNTNYNYTNFKMTGKIAASGNCNALWNKDDLNANLKAYCGFSMFYNCSSLTTAPELPATTLASRCYADMFRSTSLTTAPELPATTLAEYCYGYMFFDCTSLTTAPELPATTLAERCYMDMFWHCTSLTTVPELPATTLVYQCYQSMFEKCTSLTTAPDLPATTLEFQCYTNMFYGCSKLNYIKCLATDMSATNCTHNWVDGVSSTGTFVKEADVSWTTGTSGIPSGWTVIEE